MVRQCVVVRNIEEPILKGLSLGEENVRVRASVLTLLKAVLHIAVHMVALEERMKGPRFDHYGPWPAAPPHVVFAE